ncbi:Presenilin-like protein At2g29900 [Linum grandiflorum]
MDERTQRPRRSSIIDSLGEEIVRIVTPVSICMFLVVILVSLLNSSSSSSSPAVNSMATIAYTETTSDSTWDKLEGALLNALVFVVVVTLATFFMVLLFYFRCTHFLKFYMGFSSFTVLLFLGGVIALFLIRKFSFPIDCFTFLVLLYNFSAVGVLAVFLSKFAIVVTQGYLVVIGILVAYWFTLLPEWTTWVLLVALALYDLAAVLLPVGPLRLLVELAISRDEDIPALVYEARPVVNHDHGSRIDNVGERRAWRQRRNAGNGSDPNITAGGDDSLSSQNRTSNASRASDSSLIITEEGQGLTVPLIQNRAGSSTDGQGGIVSSDSFLEGIGLGSSGAIKLGLGDFIFYSVLVGRAAMYDFMTVYACYLAIIAGLGVTLMLLALYQQALPALPVSIALGVLFYFLTRLLLEEFVVQCSLNLVMF